MAQPTTSLPNLRAARVAAGLSQEELAERSGMSSHSIISYELGRAKASIAAANLLGDVLGVDPTVLCENPSVEVTGQSDGAAA